MSHMEKEVTSSEFPEDQRNKKMTFILTVILR